MKDNLTVLVAYYKAKKPPGSKKTYWEGMVNAATKQNLEEGDVAIAIDRVLEDAKTNHASAHESFDSHEMALLTHSKLVDISAERIINKLKTTDAPVLPGADTRKWWKILTTHALITRQNANDIVCVINHKIVSEEIPDFSNVNDIGQIIKAGLDEKARFPKRYPEPPQQRSY